MRNFIFSALAVIAFFGGAGDARAASYAAKWEGFTKDSVISPLDGYVNRFYYRSAVKDGKKKPLVVSLHQWSADYAHYSGSLAEQTLEGDWNYIHPDFRGPNNHPKACGSPYVISDIDQAIDWAIKHLPVDESRIYIVGASGGGYASLCHLMLSSKKIREYSVWVPITDLDRWYYESLSRVPRYADNIRRCVGDENGYSAAEAHKRSPLYMTTPVGKFKDTKVNIYVGIHDGYKGSVPIIHSITFYNKVAKDLGAKEENLVPWQDISWMLTTRTAPAETNIEMCGRKVHCFRAFGNVSLTVFEGAHEMIAERVPVLIGLKPVE